MLDVGDLIIIKVCKPCRSVYKRGMWVSIGDLPKDELDEIVNSSYLLKIHHTLCPKCKRKSKKAILLMEGGGDGNGIKEEGSKKETSSKEKRDKEVEIKNRIWHNLFAGDKITL